MMINYRKLISSPFFWAVLGVVSGLAYAGFPMIRDYYKVEGKSYISSEYSEKKFRSVQTGQTMNDVLKIMGEPVGAATSGKWNVWCYALQGVSEPHVRRIIYFKNGRVEEILIMGKVGK